jgi:hypothetical protein
MDDPDLQIVSPLDQNNPVPVVIGVAVYMFNPRKTGELSVQKVALFAPHTEMSAMPGGENQVIGVAPSSEDDLYVVATVKITDKLRLPIFVDSYSATLTNADGGTVEATIIAGPLLPRLGETFPQILPMVNPPEAKPILFDDAIAPGDTRVGTVVLLFPQASEKVWREKKSAVLTVGLAHNASSLTAPLP